INNNWSFEGKAAGQEVKATAANQTDLVHRTGGNNYPEKPRNLTFATIGTLRSNLVNEFRYGYIMDNSVFNAISPTNISGFNVAVDIARANSAPCILDQPIDVDTHRALRQSLKSATYQ